MKLVKFNDHYYLLSSDEIRPGDWMADKNGVHIAPAIDGFIGFSKVIASTLPLEVKGEKEGDNTWVTKLPLLERARTERHIAGHYISKECLRSYENMGEHSTVQPSEKDMYMHGWRVGFAEGLQELCGRLGLKAEEVMMDIVSLKYKEWTVLLEMEEVKPDPGSTSQFEPFWIPKVTNGFINITGVTL